ncbi:transcription factor bHLH115 [Canna indica]|uniref:Transcription factor bHLH115 n=1 Tax=Canna indica TaxID=4628 RepID=A0AAQ3JPE3_9LILI|nr:transcription factor bHLH115 [Canna indica]
MSTESIDEYWVDGGGSDGEMRCAIDSFCNLDPTVGVGMEAPYKDLGGLEQNSSRKRARDQSNTSKSKACREKMRRDKLNERFLELSSILEPGRPPKTEKVTILSDATRMLKQLRSEAQELKESNKKLEESIKDLKIEKNELREDKIKLKADKDKLEQQIKALSPPPAGFMPQPIAFQPPVPPGAFALQVPALANKTSPFPGYRGMAMWQWLPPAVVDTTQDAKLWPPNA